MDNTYLSAQTSIIITLIIGIFFIGLGLLNSKRINSKNDYIVVPLDVNASDSSIESCVFKPKKPKTQIALEKEQSYVIYDAYGDIILQGKSNETLDKDSVKILETNLDDVSGEVIANTIEKLMENGAKDVTVTQAITKKGRPTQLISIICNAQNTNSLLNILISETRTLGVRIRTSERYIVPRKILESDVTLENQKFTIHYKISDSDHFKLEFEDVKSISNTLNISFNKTEELLKEQIKKKND